MTFKEKITQAGQKATTIRYGVFIINRDTNTDGL